MKFILILMVSFTCLAAFAADKAKTDKTKDGWSESYGYGASSKAKGLC